MHIANVVEQTELLKKRKGKGKVNFGGVTLCNLLLHIKTKTTMSVKVQYVLVCYFIDFKLTPLFAVTGPHSCLM